MTLLETEVFWWSWKGGLVGGFLLLVFRALDPVSFWYGVILVVFTGFTFILHNLDVVS
jgi:hypothetical protein